MRLKPFFCIAGPCVIESREICLKVAEFMHQLTQSLGIDYIFKASFDKANRTSKDSFRGCGLDEGLKILAEVQTTFCVPVLTDVHEVHQVRALSEVVDVLQIPAFLCRQTDLIVAAARSHKTVNIKKGQFLAPLDMRFALEKFYGADGKNVWITERGSCFGYHDLVVDMRGLAQMQQDLAVPIVFDATHSVQKPGAGHGLSLGERELAPVLARAAAAVGINGLFCEVHPRPDEALSDAATSLDFAAMTQLLTDVVAIDKLVQANFTS